MEKHVTKFKCIIGGNAVVSCSLIEKFGTTLSSRVMGWAGLGALLPICRTLSNGENHNSVAASIPKLFTVLVAPTQREQSIADGY